VVSLHREKKDGERGREGEFNGALLDDRKREKGANSIERT
jgi:hypothetical protein